MFFLVSVKKDQKTRVNINNNKQSINVRAQTEIQTASFEVCFCGYFGINFVCFCYARCLQFANNH